MKGFIFGIEIEIQVYGNILVMYVYSHQHRVVSHLVVVRTEKRIASKFLQSAVYIDSFF